MALRYTRASVKGNDAFSQMQASENFVPARESGKQILGGKLGSTIAPNNGVTTRGGLRSTNTKTTAPSAGLSRQIAELRAPGTSHLGLRSSNVPSSKPSDVPLKSVCYTYVTFHFSYYFILVFIYHLRHLGLLAFRTSPQFRTFLATLAGRTRMTVRRAIRPRLRRMVSNQPSTLMSSSMQKPSGSRVRWRSVPSTTRSPRISLPLWKHSSVPRSIQLTQWTWSISLFHRFLLRSRWSALYHLRATVRLCLNSVAVSSASPSLKKRYRLISI